MGTRRRALLASLALLALCATAIDAADSIWDLEAVDANGVATDPRVGADPFLPSSWVTIEGIALNASSDLLDPAVQWQVYVQAEAPDGGGIAAWQGAFFNPDGWPWPPFPAVAAGDRVRIEGLVLDHNGKVNINCRHSSDPIMQFTVTVLQPGIGMPAPMVIPDLTACTYFDPTRSGGGELYQGQWCRLNDVTISAGTWSPGQTVSVTDDSAASLYMLLSTETDFGGYAVPVGRFSVSGIFDQEDGTPPPTANYRLWVKRFSDLEFPMTIDYGEGPMGDVRLDPAPDDANAPSYAGGTEVTLTAVAPNNKHFVHWLIYDSNYPDDANYAVTDANETISIVIADETHVSAIFKCGSGLEPLFPVTFLVLAGLAVVVRRDA